MRPVATKCQVTILVKALPRPSAGYSETVCCAGVTSDGRWKRLYPIRYRHGGESFTRWDQIEYQYVNNPQDKRHESCKVLQGTIRNLGVCKGDSRRTLLEPLITSSTDEAARLGRSLTAIRPKKINFVYRPKPSAIIAQEAAAYKNAARQADMLDLEVEPFQPTPYALAFSFEDAEGSRHLHQCGDWETHTAFWKWRKTYGDARSLQLLKDKYEIEYAGRGIAFVMGTLAKRPRQWTLLGIVRLDEGQYQTSLAL